MAHDEKSYDLETIREVFKKKKIPHPPVAIGVVIKNSHQKYFHHSFSVAKMTLESQMSVRWFVCPSVCLSTIKLIDHQAYQPSSLSTIKPIDHQAYQPSSLSTIKPIDHQAYRPSSLLTIKPIDHQAYRPSSLSTIKPIYHRAYQPSSLSTI